jgi:branched-chain amino acid transport system permease protein
MGGFDIVAFQLLNGLVWGLLLALIALGLCLIYGLMHVTNLAHGSLFMLGAVLTAYACNNLGLSFWVAALATPLVVAALMLLLDRVLFTRVLGRDMTVSILATAGLLLVIDNVVLALFGGEPVSVDAPLQDAVEAFGISYPGYRLVAAGIAVVVLLAFGAFLKFTRYGLFMRAVPQARALAATTGVPIARVNALTIALGGLTAGLAGALATPITGAHFQMGLAILAPSFIVVVVGGLGNLEGTVAVAIIYGLLRGVLSVVITPTAAEATTLLALLPLLYLRPNGLFGGRS